MWYDMLTHFPLLPHICITELNIIGLDNGLSPLRHHAIIQTNNNFSSITTQDKHFNGKNIQINQISFKKLHGKLLSVILPLFCPRENELILTILGIF